MNSVKLRKVGNSLCVTLPKDVLNQLNLSEGDDLTLTVNNDGINLSPFDPHFAQAMEAYKIGDSMYKNALKELADG